MEKKPAMCLSHEEQTSIRALAGTVEETVELSQSLYNAVVQVDERVSADEHLSVTGADEPPTRKALKTGPLPVFEEESGSKG